MSQCGNVLMLWMSLATMQCIQRYSNVNVHVTGSSRLGCKDLQSLVREAISDDEEEGQRFFTTECRCCIFIFQISVQLNPSTQF